MTQKHLYGAIEAGGTKFICAVGGSVHDLKNRLTFLTDKPQPTLQKAIDFLRENQPEGGYAGLGIASFGPLDLHPHSATYGYITSTPKSGWQNTNFLGAMRQAFSVPASIDTDVNAAAAGEYEEGAARNKEVAVYWTVGTGVGGGAMVGGKPLHGSLHPEMGHMLLPLHPDDQKDASVCPYHPNCLEGLASGPSIAKRTGKDAQELRSDDPIWDLVSHYLALGIVNVTCILSPQIIILGGGVMKQEQLLPSIRSKVQSLLNGYLQIPTLNEDIDEYIVAPYFGQDAGLAGAFTLASRAAEAKRDS